MFEGKRYKKTAKSFLKGRRSIPALVCLLCYVILLLPGIKDLFGSFNTERFNFGNLLVHYPASNFSALFVFLASGIFSVATAYFYLKLIENAVEKPKFDSFLEGLSFFGRGMLCTLWKTLWLWLWALLFLVPAIVKFFAYSQMEYIIAENPKISVIKAMKISKIMTQGHKADLFCLHFSFIGWYLLCIVPGLFLLVTPYVDTTMAITYKNLKALAIDDGKLTAEDFN